MDKSFDPVIQLKALLGDKPNHPWGALIPQVLLWCFRRFCIQKLTETSEELLLEQLWDDHFDLIHQHAPRGLESVSSSWFTPENIEHVHSSLEEYNRFFMEVLVMIDHSVRESDEECESTVAEFLDVKIKEIVNDWLGVEFKPFLIFPIRDEDEDEFTEKQFNNLIDALMEFMQANPEPVAPPVPVMPVAPSAPLRGPYDVITSNPPDYPYLKPPPPPPVSAEFSVPYLFFQYPMPIKERLKTRRMRIGRIVCGKTRRIH
jgi:hypothetical protein